MKAPREEVYAVLSDIGGFASLVEGLNDLRCCQEGGYEATLTTKVAYMSFKFKVNVALTIREAPQKLVAKIEGVPMGLIGRLSAVTTTFLTDCGDSTLIQYEVESTLTGKLGSIGQPVLKAKARDMEKQFEKKLQCRFNSDGGIS